MIEEIIRSTRLNVNGNVLGEIIDITKGQPFSFFSESNYSFPEIAGLTIHNFEKSYPSNGENNEFTDAIEADFTEYDYSNYDYAS
jgi:hypothetical protein